MIKYINKNGEVLKETSTTVERQDKSGKSLDSSSGIKLVYEDKDGNVIREEKKAEPKKPAEKKAWSKKK